MTLLQMLRENSPSPVNKNGCSLVSAEPALFDE